MTVGRILHSDDDIAEGAACLARVESRFGRVWAVTGAWPLRRRDAGFATLLHSIIGQQVSVASAGALWDRVIAAGLDDPARLAAADDAAMRACGFSRPKARYARALALSGFDFDALCHQPDDVVIAQLQTLLGIGRWTAEIYAGFALGRADVIPAGDLALQEAARRLFDLPARPSDAQLRALAQPWSPWRGVAARGLWAYYQHETFREGIR